MSPEENNEIVEDKFSLSELLTPDTPEVKEIKSIYEREYEYSIYLREIEFSISRHYYEENRNLKDKDVISAVKNIKQNRDKPTSFFKKDLKKEIVESLIEPLEESPLTNHEFNLVLDYILWVVDNRSWLEDKQAYVKWITYVLGFLSEEEEGKYERQFKKLTRRAGLSAAQAEMLLMKREMTDDFFGRGKRFKGVADKTEILEKDRTAEDLETGFFLMTDDEKFDFLLENGPDYVEFVQSYVSELVDKGDFEKIQVFYKKLNEKHNDFFILHFIMGTAYIDKDPTLAKSYFEEALKTAENYEEIPTEMIEDLRESINLLTKFLMEESAGKTEEKTGEIKKGKKGEKMEKKLKK
jgi:hypothetical protein